MWWGDCNLEKIILNMIYIIYYYLEVKYSGKEIQMNKNKRVIKFHRK
jgi:hypothetical protein